MFSWQVILHDLIFFFSYPSIWLGVTYDPFTRKVNYCNKEIQTTFRPWCPGKSEADFNDEGLLCVTYYIDLGGNRKKCITPKNCGDNSKAVVSQIRFSTLLTYIRVAQNLIDDIKNDCKSCKKQQHWVHHFVKDLFLLYIWSHIHTFVSHTILLVISKTIATRARRNEIEEATLNTRRNTANYIDLKFEILSDR